MDSRSLPRPCTALIVAAGSSRRMGFDKLSANLCGVKVLQRTLNAFLAAETIGGVVVVCPEERFQELDLTQATKPVQRAEGGADRQDSVAAGLAAVSTGWVAVHDGARPLVLPSEIDRCVALAISHRAAALARRVTETLKRADAEQFTTAPVPRENLWFMETPQVFEVALLRTACHHVAASGLHVTDDVSALESIGVNVRLVESTHPNLKITTPADLLLAAAILSHEQGSL